MGIYAQHIGPRIVRCLCCNPNIAQERGKVVPRARGTVLEIGIGPGLNLPYYDSSHVERVIGVDPSEDFVRLGKDNLASSAVPVTLIQAPAERIPLDDASADTAVITYTLCSVHDPAQALREVRRVLRPGGSVLFLEHGLSGDAAVARWQKRLNPIWRPLAVGCNLTRPVAKLLESAGFRIEQLEEFYLPATPRPVGFHSRGTAKRIH
ncbi:class I SAM-dependent methyltransferase [Microvirga roseola]|uniref:class I SAM-dependent methyltransferase n=1 Tax=Microvirga roseola TaxID=2883126 RepID=UPI001E42241B|nr:class I SAM-dependent methyltransferase [Microvirga roseola]